MHGMGRLLSPDRWKLLCFAACGLLVAGAYVQAWAFGARTDPKPLLYDALRPVPLWPLAAVLMTPFLALAHPVLLATGVDLTAADSAVTPVLVVPYLHVAACLLVTLFRRLRQPARPRA